MESRTAKTKRNAFSSIILNAINLLVAFCGRVIFVKVLDDSYLGINGLFTNILGILSLADLGMATVMMYHLYKPISENNAELICSLIKFFKKIYSIIATTILVLGLALIPFLKYIVNLPSDIPNIYLFYVVALLNVVLSYLFVYRTTLIMADQKAYVLNNCVIVFNILIFLCQTVVLFLFKNYLVYLLVALVLKFVCNLVQNGLTLKMYPFLKNITRIGTLESNEKKLIFKDIKATFLYKICGTVQSNTDSILISIFCGTILVGYYFNYILFINQIVLIISILFNSAKASVGNLMVTNTEEPKDKWDLFLSFELLNYLIVGVSSVCFFVLSNDFVKLIFGYKYVLSLPIVAAITLNFYTSNIRQNIWMFRETTGMFEPMKYITAVTAIINLVLSIVLGKHFGMLGIILATVFARMVYAWWKEPQVLCKTYFKCNEKVYYAMYLKRLILCIAIALGLNRICDVITFSNAWIEFIIKALVCFVLSCSILIIIYHRTKQLKFLIKHILPKKIVSRMERSNW